MKQQGRQWPGSAWCPSSPLGLESRTWLVRSAVSCGLLSRSLPPGRSLLLPLFGRHFLGVSSSGIGVLREEERDLLESLFPTPTVEREVIEGKEVEVGRKENWKRDRELTREREGRGSEACLIHAVLDWLSRSLSRSSPFPSLFLVPDAPTGPRRAWSAWIPLAKRHPNASQGPCSNTLEDVCLPVLHQLHVLVM